LEEFGIHHEEYVVPPDVLAAIEENKRKTTAKNVTMVAELKKRKGMAGPKALAKKLKTSTAAAIPAISSGASSPHTSASAREESVDGIGEDRADSIPEVDKPTFFAGAEGGHELEGVEIPEPSVANLLPNVMGRDSSFEDAEATGGRATSPPKETEAQETSRCHPVAVEDVSDDEANSEPTTRLQSATYRQLQSFTASGGVEAGVCEMQMSKMPLPSCPLL
jgi:hypothetical protein